MDGKDMALKQFEVENKIEVVDPDSIYKYDHQYDQMIRQQKPWKKDFHYFKKCKISAVALIKNDHQYDQMIRQQKPWKKDFHYFKKCEISAVALIKMVMHARSGGNLEIMGMLQGRIDGDSFIIMDAFAIPAEGIETRVDPGAEGFAYIVRYVTLQESVGRPEKTFGWYHSHPGYGCWLSGVDVATQSLHQDYEDPWLAIVVDPKRTMSSGKVDIGAFRTYPKHYTPPQSDTQDWQPIPQDKVEDFGTHNNRYYSLEVSFFKSSVDSHLLSLLWEKYWINTLASSSLLVNRVYNAGQITDFARKLEEVDAKLKNQSGWQLETKKSGGESPLVQLNKDCAQTTIEQLGGVMGLTLKNYLFNGKGSSCSKDSKMEIDD